MSKNITVHK